MKKVPCLPVMLLLEILMTICAVIALVATVILVVLGIMALIFVWGSRKWNTWKMMDKIWKPWWLHWRVWAWSYGVCFDPDCNPNDMDFLASRDAAARDAKKAKKEEKSRRPQYDHYYETPSWDPIDVLAGIWFALEFGYLLVPLIYLIVSMICLRGAFYIHLHLNAKPPAHHQVVKKPDYVPTEIQKQEQDFGPFYDQKDVDILRRNTGVNNFALISDTGEIRYSTSWTVNPVDRAWRVIYSSKYITQHDVKGTAATFTDDRTHVYNINVNQPFQFENKGTMVYLFTTDGSLLQAERDDLKKLPLGKVKSNVRPNSQLTIL